MMKENTLLRELLKYVALNVCGMIGLSCYILADTFFISKGLGAKGLTALNLAIPVYSFVNGCGLMLGIGGGTKYSICRGQKKDETANQVFTHTLSLLAVFSVVFVLAGIFLSGKLTALLGANAEVFEMTKIYLRVILLFAPAFLLNNALLAFVRNDGNPGLAMLAMLAGSFSNILLDYLFIFPLGLGIFGAVLATGFAPVISMAVLSKHWLSKQNQFHVVRGKWSVALAGNILSLGIPSFVAELASGIVIIVFNMVILRLEGNIGVAAYGVVANLSLVVTAIYTGIAQGAQPVLSREYGLGEQKRTRQILRYAVILMLVLSVLIYLFFFTTADPITQVFNSEQNPKLQEIAVFGLKLYFTAVPFAGFNILLATYFTSIEKAVSAQVISFSRGFLVILPVIFLLAYLFQMTGIWLSYPITEAGIALLGLLLFQRRNNSIP